MSGIFEADEIEAANAQAPAEEHQGDATDQQQDNSQPRDEHGRFSSKQPEESEGGDQSTEAERNERTVNHGAFHKEREQRKHWQGVAEGYKAQLDQLAALRQQLAQSQQQPAQSSQQDDPSDVNYLAQKVQHLAAREQQRETHAYTAQIDQREQQMLSQAITASEAEYKQTVPDYDDAVKHLVQARAMELQVYGMSPQEIQQAISQEAYDLAATALRQNRSPAEVAYEVAKYRGYRPNQGQQQTNQGVAQIEAINRGQAQSRSLGGAGGAAPSKDLNANAIAALSTDEFDKLYATPEGRAQIDRIMGAM